MKATISERRFQAHRLHQFRVEARLTIADAAKNAGIREQRWFDLEYRNVGRVKEIKALIALFVPGERRMRLRDDQSNPFARVKAIEAADRDYRENVYTS